MVCDNELWRGVWFDHPICGDSPQKLFDYKETTQYVSRTFYTYDNWTDLIYYELANGRPVVYGGESSGGGHEFVCDGYKYENSTDYFHINWGWGGYYDNYFALSALNPEGQGVGGSSTSDGYNSGQDAVIGIQKSTDNGTMSDIEPIVLNLKLNSMTLSSNEVIVNTEIYATLNITNNNAEDFDGNIYLGRKNGENYEILAGNSIAISGGQTAECVIPYTPTETGTYYFVLWWPDVSGGYATDGTIRATLTVTDGDVPINLESYDVTSSSAVISWGGNEADNYNVRYRTAGRDAVVFSDDFENGLGNWTIYTEGEVPFADYGWFTYNTSSWDVDAHSGTSAAVALSYNGKAYNANNWLVTPQLTMGKTLKFWVNTYSYCPDSYEVLLSTSGKAIADFTVTLQEMAKAPTNGEWNEVTIDLSAYEGQQGYIAIHHVSNDCYYLFIDDFGIYTDALEPGEWMTQSTEEMSITLTGLAPETTYEYQVQAVNGGEQSEWSSLATFTTPAYAAVELSDNATDNSSTVVAHDGEEAVVTLAGRTLYKDGEWNTICLPFDLVLEGSPLEGATAKTLVNATMTGTTVTLTFGDAVDNLEAGVPYIIKWNGDTENIVDPMFTGVTLVSGSADDRTITKADGHVKFIGYYDAFTINADNADIYYMTTGNLLKHTAKERTLKACSAYFQFSENIVNSTRQFVLDFGEGNTTTVIGEIEDGRLNIERGDWYTVDGVKHDKQPVRKGLYIQNGKKVVIK